MKVQNPLSVVKTLQAANVLKLVRDGTVVGSVLIVDGATAELRDNAERLMGSYSDAATAIDEFEKATSFEEIELDL